MSSWYTERRCFTTLTVGLLLATGTLAEPINNDPTVSVTGEAIVKCTPDRMRVSFSLKVKRPDIEKGLERFEARRKEVLDALEKEGALADSIKVGEISFSQAGGSENRQMQRMVFAQMSQRNIDTEALKKLPTTISATVTADFPIKGDAPIERQLAAHKLSERINAANFHEPDADYEPTPEEEELMEEMEEFKEMMSSWSDEEKEDIRFTYVAVLSDEQIAQAYADAYAKAVRRAKRLIAATGLVTDQPLTLYALSGVATSGRESDQERMARMYMAAMGAGSMGETDSDSENEVIGYSPSEIEYRVTLNTKFLLPS